MGTKKSENKIENKCYISQYFKQKISIYNESYRLTNIADHFFIIFNDNEMGTINRTPSYGRSQSNHVCI